MTDIALQEENALLRNELEQVRGTAEQALRMATLLTDKLALLEDGYRPRLPLTPTRPTETVRQINRALGKQINASHLRRWRCQGYLKLGVHVFDERKPGGTNPVWLYSPKRIATLMKKPQSQWPQYLPVVPQVEEDIKDA